MGMSRTYSEMVQIHTFLGRFDYLRLLGSVGSATFGFDRYINQAFYRSAEWRRTRELVIIRDNGCDLGISGREINGGVLIHHMNPVAKEDILGREEWILSPENLITTTQATHNAIHYGDRTLLFDGIVERTPGDTKLW